MVWHENQSLVDPRIAGGIRRPVASADDPDFASVVLLLDFAGVDGAQDITDLSNSAHVDTFLGSAQVDTDIKFLGVNTLLTNAFGDAVTFPNSTDWAFGTGDFTIEFGSRFITLASSPGWMGYYLGTADGWFINFVTGTPSIRMIAQAGVIIEETWAAVIDTDYHVAFCRAGTDFRIFIDGIQLGSTTTDSTDITSLVTTLNLGEIRSGVNIFKGNLGAVRITKGIARYTANFTPPTEFYPTS